ncbi:MAG: class I SAM-dependent methyltransferase [Leptospirales bacterium]|nr:class I SAM-dependent methyltransferase [Leptospirales bacterium]
MTAAIHQGIYARLFARFYDRFMQSTEQRALFRKRRRLLSKLQGDILEIGSGTGVNFAFYPAGCRVLAAEPAPAMMERARAAAAALPEGRANIETILAGVGDAELEQRVAAASTDYVVCTLVLCTVPDLQAALDWIDSRLKPGGRLVLIEHVRAASAAGRALQGALNPVWKRFALGCHLNRDPAAALGGLRYQPIEEQSFVLTMPFYCAVWEKPAKAGAP